MSLLLRTLIKKKIKCSSYKGNSEGSGAKSYMRRGFLIYEKMRKYFTIYVEAVSHAVYDFAPDPSDFTYI
jgi:hypothetical protein